MTGLIFYLFRMTQKHRTITADAIRSLVSEDAAAQRVAAEIPEIYGALDRAIKPFFQNGRKLKGEELRQLFENCIEHFKRMAPPVDYDSAFRPPTRTRPKGEAYQARFVSAKRIENSLNGREQYQLFAFTIFASRKAVVLDYQEHPITFQYHTAERLLERSQEKASAIWRLANAVYKWSAVIILAQKHSLADLDSRMLLPLEESGILLGDYVPRSLFSGTRRTYDANGCREQKAKMENTDYTFLARTFVSVGMLRPEQIKLMNDMNTWEESHSAENLDCIRSHFWRRDMDDLRNDLEVFGDATYDSLAAIMNDPDNMTTIKGR